MPKSAAIKILCDEPMPNLRCEEEYSLWPISGLFDRDSLSLDPMTLGPLAANPLSLDPGPGDGRYSISYDLIPHDSKPRPPYDLRLKPGLLSCKPSGPYVMAPHDLKFIPNPSDFPPKDEDPRDWDY